MANKVIVDKERKTVYVRIDNAYTRNEKHFIEAYENNEGKKSFFGSFKFKEPAKAEKTLREAVAVLEDWGQVDTIFESEFARWEDNNFGQTLNVGNRVKFYQGIKSKDKVPDDDIQDYIYSLEIQLSPHSKGGIYMRVARAIVQDKDETAYNNDLYTEEDLPF